MLAARSHVDHLLEQGTPVADVAAWLQDQLDRRPYLRHALSGRLAELQAEARRTARPPEKTRRNGPMEGMLPAASTFQRPGCWISPRFSARRSEPPAFGPRLAGFFLPCVAASPAGHLAVADVAEGAADLVLELVGIEHDLAVVHRPDGGHRHGHVPGILDVDDEHGVRAAPQLANRPRSDSAPSPVKTWSPRRMDA